MNSLEWIKRFEEYVTLVKNRSNNTVKSYIIDVELLYRFVTTGELGKPRVKTPLVESAFDWADFTEEEAVAYMRQLKQTATGTTIQRKVYVLKQFFKFLRKKGVTAADPFGDVVPGKVLHKLPVVLSIQEMSKLLTCIRQPLPALLGVPTLDTFLAIRDRAMLETLYSAALRVGGLVGLNWGDVDLNKRLVRVVEKGNKERLCPLGPYAVEALIAYARHYEQHWQRRPEGPAPVWLSSWNMRINQRTIPRTIRKWCRAAGVKRVNPHAFRHSAATHMMEKGADIRVIQAILGHAHIETTAIYTHVATRQISSTHANTHPRG